MRAKKFGNIQKISALFVVIGFPLFFHYTFCCLLFFVSRANLFLKVFINVVVIKSKQLSGNKLYVAIEKSKVKAKYQEVGMEKYAHVVKKEIICN